MRRILLFLCIPFLTFIASSLFIQKASAMSENIKTTTLPLSHLQIRISSREGCARFRLYETQAAKQFYDQLPLKLEVSNFRDAQWMFYPPKKLSVHSGEAYHDGKKGELSYYEPWGDVFMLYKDFYAGDEMHRLGIVQEGIDNIEAMSGTVMIEKMMKE